MADVVVKGISKNFGDHRVIGNLDLEVKDGEFVTLLGPSGCGKTTLLRMIAGLEKIDKGDLFVGGKRYNDIPAQRRSVAMVFQSYALFPHMSVHDNIRFGLKIRKVRKEEIKRKIAWALSMLNLDGLENRLPREISGGQRQRVALARALVLDPDVLLLDEPLSNLDTTLRDKAMEELKRIHRQVHTTIIYVSHNQVEAMTMSDRIALLNGGCLEQYDTPRMVYDEPRTLFSASFIGSPAMNIFEGRIEREDDMMGVSTPIGFFMFDKEAALRTQAMAGSAVTVGVRPQNITRADRYAARRYSDTMVTLTVELVQSLGDRSLIVGRGENDAVVRFLVAREDDIGTGQQLPVFIDGRKIHLFDPLRQMNLLSKQSDATLCRKE
jgi:multiple sugar transport system ATP-binding protein